MQWFILGRERLISAAEISAVLGYQDNKYNENSPILKSDTEIHDAGELMAKLGGTIKIGVEIGANLSEQELITAATKALTNTEGKIHFGISVYEDHATNPRQLAAQIGTWGKKIKTNLKNIDRSVRHVFNYEPVLSSVTVVKNGLNARGTEFLIYKKGNKFDLAKTVVVQPFEEFSARDFGRPGRDDLSGMLPPKLAMMMINIANPKNSSTILDPFCGSGTIITEALLMGFEKIIGTDISDKAIADSQKNINWTADKVQIPTDKIKIFVADAKILSSRLPYHTVDTVVTEPYLGKPLKGNETLEVLRAQATELKKIYIESFQSFAKVLKPGGVVVFLIPRFRFRDNWITIDIKNEIQKIGFTAEPLINDHESLLYARPNQRVGREIWKFKLL